MTMRDLIPWGRQESRSPAPYRTEERNPLAGFRREVERLFDDFFGAPLAVGRAAAWPAVDVDERDDEVRVTAEVPGMDAGDIDLVFDDGVLTISGEKKAERDDEARGWSERFYGRFERRIALPRGTEADGAKAAFRDGVLSITLPRSGDAASGRRIPIGGTRH